MGGNAYTFKLFGLTFNWTNIISCIVVCVLVFILMFALSRHVTMKPKGGQNLLEWLIDFTNSIVRGQFTSETAGFFEYFIFILFVFLFVSNQLGLFVQIGWNGHELVRSPTADPVITLTFSMSAILLSHFAGMTHRGLKEYFKGYVEPNAIMMPINLIEEFSNFLTLGLRIFGNIYSGELLLGLLGKLAFSHGVPTILVSLPIEMVWQGFSVFIGAIQAYVFVTLTSVYISRKVVGE